MTAFGAERTLRHRDLRWYVARLRAMSPAEIGWRTTTGLRRLVLQPRVEPRPVDWQDGPWTALIRSLTADAAPGLVDAARQIAAGELSFWGREARVDPRALPWQDGPFAERAAAGDAWALDPKCGLELERQQHLFTLAAGGESRLCLDQIGDWIARHPEHDDAWRSGYESAHRVVAWTWALPFAAGSASTAELARIDRAFLRSAAVIAGHPSRYSSANNHRLAELAGLLAFEAVTRDRTNWEAVWRSFEAELLRQTYADGGSREQAGGYFLYVLEIVWTAALFAHAVGQPLGRVAERADAMLDWLRAVAGGDGEPPAVGDDAEDRFVRPDYFEPRRAGVLAARMRSVLDGRPTLEPVEAEQAEAASRALSESGYVVLRARARAGDVRVVLDTGELGLGTLAAHGHADALALTVDVDGIALLRDSGTGTYSSAGGRDCFRITSAHNSVTIDGESQAEPAGPHLWARRFSPLLEHVQLGGAVDYARASHDGYRARDARAVHTRSVTFVKPDLLLVLDRVTAEQACVAELTWQTLPGRALDDVGVTVAASPEAAQRVEQGPFSKRFTWIRDAPRTLFRSEGRDIAFATAIAFTRARPLVLRHGAAETVVELGADPPLRVVERWTGGAAIVEGA